MADKTMTDIGFSMIASHLNSVVVEADQMLSLADQAKAQQKLGEYKKAALKYELAIKEDPSSFELYFNMGICLDKADEIESAITAFKSAAVLKPQHKPTLLHLASLHIEKGDKDESMKYWNRYQGM
jgi:Tfp pilus assembly protein PilF